ncbi:nitroreductase [Sphingomonas sp. BIUV-7]|uniref:Putative NAD(P)H nitroreductase n=1 Tax=Sphingomonas natans TaxID=3063330 RepID=A0ABT8Y5C7_9SPHN|nr:nitroreductase [Sphingomonas sp. BIUV-7]MDO6413528.1 nitroreductase [Sphingomonas sp. BIUV-7]
MFNDLATPASLLATRRSGKARDLAAPGPDAAQLDRILAAATRVPDHGKLAPWRFVIVPLEKRADFAALLHDAYAAQKDSVGRIEREAIDQFAHQAPCLIVAVSNPAHASHIPIWEQELSVGAACQNLVLAAHAEGFLVNWLSTWAAFSSIVCAAFGGGRDARIAGFFFIGTSAKELEERPRPDRDAVIAIWQGR